jgi:hypothetical protein
VEKIEIVWIKSHAQPVESWIAVSGKETIGHIYMLLERENRIKFLDAWVHPEWRGNGVFRKLWDARWESVSLRYPGHTVYAWCKETSLPLLLEKGFSPGEKCTYVELTIPDRDK